MPCRGLTNYPVLILTIISLIAISHLSLTILEKLYSLENNQQDLTNIMPRIEYLLDRNSIFLHVSPPIFPYISEIIIFSDGSSVSYRLKQFNGLYGPLILPFNAKKIIIIGNGDKPWLLDVLLFKEVDESVNFSINRYLPPSLEIDFKGEQLILLNSLNASNYFIILKPITYEKQISITRNNTYLVKNGHVLVNKGVNKEFLIHNTTLSNNIDVEERFVSLLKTYGEIIEHRKYLLNIYKYRDLILDPTIVSVSGKIASNPTHIRYVLQLGQIKLDDEVLIRVCINVSFGQVEVRDLYGNTYLAKVVVKALLYLTSINSKYDLYLGRTVLHTGSYSSITVTFRNYTYLKSNIYTIDLILDYLVYIEQAIPFSAYFVSNQLIYGGYDNYVYFKSFTYDALKIITDNEILYYKPIGDNTIVNITIHGIIDNDGSKYIINNEVRTKYYTILYTGDNDIYVEDYVKPHSLLYMPLFIEIYINTGTERFKMYLIKRFSNNTLLYGFYILGNKIDLILKFFPAIIAKTNYILFNDEKLTFVYLLMTFNETYIVWDDNVVRLPRINEIHGFVSYMETKYEYPLLLINNSLGLHGIVSVKYIDNRSEYYNITYAEKVYYLDNNLIKGIDFVFYNFMKGKLLVSTIHDSIIAFTTGTNVFSVINIEELRLEDNMFYIAHLSDGDLIIFNQ